MKKLKPTRKGGHHSWTEDEIKQFEARHPVGSRPRLALAFLLYCGQRKSDVARMGPQHVRNGTMQMRQDKIGAEPAIPVHSTLAAVIAASGPCQLGGAEGLHTRRQSKAARGRSHGQGESVNTTVIPRGPV